MSNNDKDRSFDSKQEYNIRIDPFPDNFEMHYNCIFNPDKPINDVDYEYKFKIIKSKKRNNISQAKESFQGLRAYNFKKCD